MSSALIGSLRVALGLDTAQLATGAKQAQTIVRTLKSQMSGLFAGMAAGLTAAGIGNAALSAIRKIADIGDTAESIGITVEQLQAYQKMALQSGTDTDTLRRGLQTLAEQSTQTGSALQKLFAANGFDIKSMNTDQIIAAFADMVKGGKDAKAQLSIITQVMGDKVGRELVEAFRTGSNGVREAYDDMIKSGEYHTSTEVQRIQKIEEKYNQVAASIETRWQQMVVKIAEGIDSIEVKYVPRSGGARSAVPGLKPPPESPGQDRWVNHVQNQYTAATKATVDPKAVTEVDQLGQKTDWLNKLWQSGAGSARVYRGAQDEQVKAYERAKAEVDNYIEGLTEERKALQLEIDTFGLSLDQKAEAEAIAQIPINASKKQREAALAEAEAIRVLTLQFAEMQKRQEAAAEIQDSLRGGFTDFISDVAHGKNVLSSLNNVLGDIEDRLLSMISNSLFDDLFGSLFKGGNSGTGNLGNLIGGLFSTESALQAPRAAISNAAAQRGGPVGMQVNIINNAPNTAVRTEERATPDGQRALYAIIDERIANQMPRVLSSGYGITPAMRKR